MDIFINKAEPQKFYKTNNKENDLLKIEVQSIQELLIHLEVCSYRALLGFTALIADSNNVIKEVEKDELLYLADEHIANIIIEIDLIDKITKLDAARLILEAYLDEFVKHRKNDNVELESISFDKFSEVLQKIKSITWSKLESRYDNESMVETVVIEGTLRAEVDNYNRTIFLSVANSAVAS